MPRVKVTVREGEETRVESVPLAGGGACSYCSALAKLR